jgi:hypothetical protein
VRDKDDDSPEPSTIAPLVAARATPVANVSERDDPLPGALLNTTKPLPPDVIDKSLPMRTAPLSPDTVLPLLNTIAPLLPELLPQPDDTVTAPLAPDVVVPLLNTTTPLPPDVIKKPLPL